MVTFNLSDNLDNKAKKYKQFFWLKYDQTINLMDADKCFI